MCRGDTSLVIEQHTVWRATRTPEGPATLRVRDRAGGTVWDASPVIDVVAWGPGARWAVAQSPELLGLHDDDPDDVQAALPEGIVREAHRRHRAKRIGATRSVTESIIPTILAQKVTSAEAIRAYRGLQDSVFGLGANFGVYADVVQPGRVRVGVHLSLIHI